MRNLVLSFAALFAVSTLAYAQETGVRISGQALLVSSENSTVHCTKCVIALSPEAKVRVTSEGLSVDSSTGAVTFWGVVRLTLADGEVVAEGGVLTTDAKGAQRFSSDELQFVSASKR
jgi:hypothetical protein